MNVLVSNFLEFTHHWAVARQPEEIKTVAADATEEKAAASVDALSVSCMSVRPQVSICAQVAHGMEHLSNLRFVHKDLAARNCLINTQRRVKVSSLSLSKDVYNRSARKASALS